MKESTLVEMQRRIEILGNAVSRVMPELEQLKTLSVGNMELVKLLPGYEAAIETMKAELEAKQEEKPKFEE